MQRNFKDTFISAIIIGTISLITFFIGLKLYYSNDKENIIEKTDKNIINDNTQILNEKEIENAKLKKEIEYLINKDSIETEKKEIELNNQKKLLDNEIISYTSLVQKYLSFSKNKELKILYKYKKELINYYKIKGLSDNANRFLKTSLKLVDNEIKLIEKELKISNDTTSLKKESIITNTSKNTIKVTNEKMKNIIKSDTVKTKSDTIK